MSATIEVMAEMIWNNAELSAPYGGADEEAKDVMRGMARKSLSTIREPSQAMIDAGAKKVRGGSATDCAAATWRAMVDEMLRQPEERPQPVAPPWEQE